MEARLRKTAHFFFALLDACYRLWQKRVQRAMTRREWLLGTAMAIPFLRFGSSLFQSSSSAPSAGERLTAIEARLGGRLGVSAYNSGDGKRLEQRASERFPMCSTFKLLAVAAILSRVDAKQETLNHVIRYTQADLLEYAPVTKANLGEGGMTISALCAAAIEYSDNTAANLLLNVLGGPSQVTAYARSLGDTITRLDRAEPDLNSALPGDERDTTNPISMLADMKKLLVDQDRLSAASQKQLQDWLVGNTTGAKSLRAGLPTDWRIGDKTGNGKNGATNDIAVCWPPNRAPILLTAYFVGSAASYDDRCAALAEAGRIVAAEFA